MFSSANNYRPCENVCELLDVFIWREPRSSRVSRDLEKMLSRFLDFGGFTFLALGRRRIFFSKTGVSDRVKLVLGGFTKGFFMVNGLEI